MTPGKRITVVNDYPDFLELMADLLSEEGYIVTTIPKHQGAFDQIKESKPDLVICDLIFDNMPMGWSLIDMLYLDPETRAIPLILCSAATQQVKAIAPTLAAKGIRWIEKPFEIEQLIATIQEIQQKQ